MRTREEDHNGTTSRRRLADAFPIKQPKTTCDEVRVRVSFYYYFLRHHHPSSSSSFFLELEKGGEDSLRFSTGQTATPSAQTNKFHTNNLTKILEHD